MSAWWEGDPSERYWMETTDRPDVGGDLRAPRTGGYGQSVGHYDLVQYVRPGDIVFHWHTAAPGGSAIVGWSEAIGPLGVEQYQWSAHAGSLAGQSSAPAPNWVMPLGGINLLDRPMAAADLLPRRDELFEIRTGLEERWGRPVYFPFIPYGQTIRAFQGYMTKMPRAVVELISELAPLELTALAVAGEAQLDEAIIPPGVPRPSTSGYQSDAVRRRAIELHAVERAIALYRSEGARDIEVLGKPYDLLVRIGSVERHIEVKGSSGTAGAVLLTRNEVHHARHHEATDLVVVDEIDVGASEDGTITTAGGRLRRWINWTPLDEHLSATAFECALPGASHATAL